MKAIVTFAKQDDPGHRLETLLSGNQSRVSAHGPPGVRMDPQGLLQELGEVSKGW